MKPNAKYLHCLNFLNSFYLSAAKNYFIKYGELGALNCAAERVLNTSHSLELLN